MLKRMLSFVLALSFTISLSIAVAFAANEQDYDDNYWCSDTSVLHSVLSGSKIIPKGVEQNQGARDVTYALHNLETESPYVEFSFTIECGEFVIPIEEQADLIITELTSNLTLAEAQVRHYESINGSEVKFNLSFAKVLEREGASITATVTSENAPGLALIAMGEAVLTADIMEYVPWFNEQEDSSESDDTAVDNSTNNQPSSDLEIVLNKVVNGKLDGYNGNGHKLHLSCSKGGRVSLGLQSTRADAGQAVLDSQTLYSNAQTSVNDLRVQIEHKQGDGKLDGLYYYGDITGEVVFDSKFEEIVQVAWDDFMPGAGVIKLLLDFLTGKEMEILENNGNRIEIQWKSGVYTDLEPFDSSPFPVVAMLMSSINNERLKVAVDSEMGLRVYLFNRNQDGRYFNVDSAASTSFYWTNPE